MELEEKLEEDIQKEYVDREKTIGNISLLSGVLGTLLGICGIFYGLGWSVYNQIKYTSPTVKTYFDMVSTKDTLIREKEYLKNRTTSFEYQSDKLKPYLEEVVDKEVQKKIEALDSAIKVVKEDIKEAETSSDVKKYKTANENSNVAVYGSAITGFLAVLLSSIGHAIFRYSNKKRRDNALNQLKQNNETF